MNKVWKVSKLQKSKTVFKILGQNASKILSKLKKLITQAKTQEIGISLSPSCQNNGQTQAWGREILVLSPTIITTAVNSILNHLITTYLNVLELRLSYFLNLIMLFSKPYWNLWFQTNVVRGIIAAVCCAVFFIGIGLVHKFRWRPTSKTDKSGGKFSSSQNLGGISCKILPPFYLLKIRGSWVSTSKWPRKEAKFLASPRPQPRKTWIKSLVLEMVKKKV